MCLRYGEILLRQGMVLGVSNPLYGIGNEAWGWCLIDGKGFLSLGLPLIGCLTSFPLHVLRWLKTLED